MKKSFSKKGAVLPVIQIGKYTKRDVAALIIKGSCHVHSSTLKGRDACVKTTQKIVSDNLDISYPWELRDNAQKFPLLGSGERHELIQRILSETGLQKKRKFSELTSTILEELMTNALYHGPQNRQGKEKYSRNQPVLLAPNEKVLVRACAGRDGVYLNIEDNGGALKVQHIQESLVRCYGNSTSQIQQKEGGAGLGLFLTFEMASHIRIDVTEGQKTSVSIWLADRNSYDPELFSFNFFNWRGGK